MAKLVAGHGKTNISCKHGSRWIWWRTMIFNPKGSWKQVVLAPDCDCQDPPNPNKEPFVI